MAPCGIVERRIGDAAGRRRAGRLRRRAERRRQRPLDLDERAVES
jgi:hypothetical protein